MKKFRMMLPVLAVVFAVAGAVGGDLLPGITAYYQTGPTTCSGPSVTEQENCQINLPFSRPICTIKVNGSPLPAFKNADCTDLLRQEIVQ